MLLRDKNDPNFGKPISPINISNAINKSMPNEVVEVINALVAMAWDGENSKIYQKDILFGIKKLKLTEMIDEKSLNFEDLFTSAGWVVECYKSPERYYIFKKSDNQFKPTLY